MLQLYKMLFTVYQVSLLSMIKLDKCFDSMAQFFVMCFKEAQCFLLLAQ